MSVTRFKYPKFNALSNDGNPLSGGKLYSYAAGTTTPLPTYADPEGLTLNPNPIILNSRGDASIFLDSTKTYKFVLKDSNDVEIWSVDNFVATEFSKKDLSNTVDGSVTTALIAEEAVTTEKAHKGYVPAGDFVGTSFVVSGFDSSIDTITTNKINVTNGVAILKQASGSAYTIEKSSNSFVASLAGATYYLYLNSDGSWDWDTSATTDPNGLLLCTVTTDSTGAITSLTDGRTFVGIDFVRQSATEMQNVGPLKIPGRGTNTPGTILQTDYVGNFYKTIFSNDGSGNFGLSLNWAGYDATYITTGNGASRVVLMGDGGDGIIDLNVAPIGTAGDPISAKSLRITSGGAFTWDGATVFTTANSPYTASYAKFANGMIIQWGTGVYVGATSSVVVTLPTAFTSALGVALAAEGNTGSDCSVSVSTATLTTITIYNPSTSARYVNWIAIGI